MKYIIFSIFLVFCQSAFCQTSTLLEVYRIFQGKCISCHNAGQKSGNLDLVGTGATENAKALSVRTNLYKVSPQNSASKIKGHQRVSPGRPDKSLVFRKVNYGLETTIQIDPSEDPAQQHDNLPLNLLPTEKEMIRQWILYGAAASGQLVNKSNVENFYQQGGLKSFDNVPPPPASNEGFQIKMGPFYLGPSGEIEYFQKWELGIPEDVEVSKIDFLFGNYSHHFLLYRFDNAATTTPDGLRENANHSNIKLVAAVQEPTLLNLPTNTAFFWNKTSVMDLNSHYINYSATMPLQAEVYVNVYTKPKGTAMHEMKSILIPNIDIPIPNNGKLITFESEFIYPQQVFVWGMMGHTHKYGRDYKIYKRLVNGQKGELIYNASCFEGNVSCPSPFYDYRHIPFKKWEPLMPLNLIPGIIHEAQYLNDGPVSVNFGPTSNDEMMLMIMFYTEDSTGIRTSNYNINNLSKLNAFPNPVINELNIEVPLNFVNPILEIIDINGSVLINQTVQSGFNKINRANLNSGIYFCRVMDEKGKMITKKICIQ